MNKLCIWIGLLAVTFAAGCRTDIVTTKRLKLLENKCIFLEQIESEDPYVGQVVRDVIEKEFLRKKVMLCNSDNATVFLSGATFLTQRATSSGSIFGTSSESTQAIESVSVVAKDSNGELLLSASYDNKEHYSASKLAKELGSALAGKLK